MYTVDEDELKVGTPTNLSAHVARAERHNGVHDAEAQHGDEDANKQDLYRALIF